MNLPSTMTATEQPKQVDHLEVGQWFWVKGDEQRDRDYPAIDAPTKEYTWLGCIEHVGSNYVQLREPESERSHGEYTRVHFDNVDELLSWEPEPKSVISKTLSHYQIKVNHLMNEVKAVTARLGVSRTALTDQVGQGSGTDLAILSEEADPNIHKQALIKAKDETLPELFEDIKIANGAVAKWMSAELTPLKIEAGELHGVIGQIEKRIFNISLYAGLTEEVVQVREGEQGAYDDKIHLMQRMMYMDEECLVDYKAGGMDMRNLSEFDEWLSKPDNLERCLPFTKCVALFQVRRKRKEREADSNAQAYINIQLAKEDGLTFMYIRNGENLYRLSTDIDFDEKMFPDTGTFDLNEPMMASTWSGGAKNFLMPVREWEILKAEQQKKEREAKAWRKANPQKKWEKANPNKSWHHYAYPSGTRNGFRKDMHDYKPFDSTNVYYDDIMDDMHEQMERFNRVALILQGVLDRSPVLHPHPKAETWKPEGFELIFKLVYDATMVLTYGEAPSFEEYREVVNALSDADSVFIGQDDFWQRKEAIKENNRRDNNWRDRSEYRPERYSPHGNDGPGFTANPAKWHHRVNKATFTWQRERQDWRSDRYGEMVNCNLVVHLDELFNVSGYKPGDYKQFYRDPRTRRDYLKWAPFLLGAEDYYAGLEKEKQK